MYSRRKRPRTLSLPLLWLQILLLHNSTSFQQPLSLKRLHPSQKNVKNANIIYLSSSTSNSASSSNNEEENNDLHHEFPEPNLLEQYDPDSERRPRRINRSTSTSRSSRSNGRTTNSRKLTTSIQDRFREWGVETIHDPTQRPHCPDSMDSMAQGAFHAISSTLYCRNLLDPNIATNAMAVSITDRRPAGFAYWPQGRDVGRLGIEIDGARHLLSTVDMDHYGHLYDSYRMKDNSVQGKVFSMKRDAIGKNTDIMLEGKALRIFSLMLASKLNQWPWDGLEEEDHDDGNNASKRPVALFFNTIRQALQASQELKMMQYIAKINGKEGMYDNIRILCLGQDDIPKDMTMRRPTGIRTNDETDTGRRRWGASKKFTEAKVDPRFGVILIVQPTDRNNEALPPSPSVGTVQNLQKLLARSTIARIPTVVISPRLTEQMDGRGIEQSGYQKSSTYGGVEPPKGPTPWILRDFIPPVFSWIGSSIEFTKRPPWSQIQETMASDKHSAVCGISYLSRVAMTQSVMESGHPWHIYAVENVCSIPSKSKKDAGQHSDLETNYHYVASTTPKAGRPSKQILLDILSEWSPP